MKKDLSKGSILVHILSLSWPMMLAMLFHIGFNIVDAMFLGRVSTDALAAISLTFPVIFFIVAIASGVGVGTTSVIARKLGAKNVKGAENTALHAVILSIIVTFIVSIIGIVVSKPLYAYLGATETIMPMVLNYSYIIFGGSVFMFIAFMGNSILRGEGNMKIPMLIMMIATVVNIVLDPIMIFGFLGFPALGVTGAALATVIARLFASAYSIYYLLSGKSILKLNFKIFKYDPKIIKGILAVGIPASLSQSIMSLGLLFLTKIVSLFGPLAIAAYGIVGRLDAVAILPVLGIATAVVTVVGFNVGAKEFHRANRAVWSAIGLSSIFMLLVAVVLFAAPRVWIGFFNTHPDIVRIGSSYLKIVVFTYWLAGIGITISAAFQGAGKGYPSLVLTIFRLFIVNIPLSYFFAVPLGMQTNGIWYGIVISTFVTAIVSVIWWSLGTWKKGHHEVQEITEPIVG